MDVDVRTYYSTKTYLSQEGFGSFSWTLGAELPETVSDVKEIPLSMSQFSFDPLSFKNEHFRWSESSTLEGSKHLKEFVDYCFDDGNQHGRHSGIGYPQGQKHSDQHEAQHQPSWIGSDDEDDT